MRQRWSHKVCDQCDDCLYYKRGEKVNITNMKRLAQQAKAAPFKQPSRRRTPPQRLQQLTVVSLFFLPYDGKSVCSKARILVGTLLPRTGVSSRSDDTWLLEGNSSIVQRIVAKILKSCEKPMISRLLEILSLDSLLTIHPGILHCCFQRSTNLPIGEPLCTCSPSNR